MSTVQNMKYLLMAFPKATFEKTQEASKVPSAGDGPGGDGRRWLGVSGRPIPIAEAGTRQTR